MFTKVLIKDLKYFKDINRLGDKLRRRGIHYGEIRISNAKTAEGEMATGYVQIDHYRYYDLKDALREIENAGYDPIDPGEYGIGEDSQHVAQA
jgi:hypothetical protein